MMLNKIFHLLLLSLIPLLGFSQANSQYPDSGNKIRLGFQTSGDGLIWRDTQPKVGGYQPINNKAAWIILDTMNNKFYHYKNSAWTLAGGQDIDTANLIATKYNLGFKLTTNDTGNMLTPYWRSGKFSGVLPVANGGTGSATQNFVDLTTTQSSIGGAKTFTSAVTATRFNPTSTSETGTGMFAPTSTSLGFSTNDSKRMTLEAGGGLRLGVDIHQLASNRRLTVFGTAAAELISTGVNNEPAVELWQKHNANNNVFFDLYTDSPATLRGQIIYNRSENRINFIGNGNGLSFTGNSLFSSLIGENLRTVNAAADGTLSASSSITIKENVNNLNYGLDKILQLQPKSFNYIDKNKYGEGLDIGFIAEDVYNIIPEATGTMNDGFIYFDAVKLIPILTKAIQEQNALIKALEQRILILENK